jgi:hypothetical protein
MKLAGKLLSVGAVGVPVGGTLMVLSQPGQSLINPLPQPKTMEEAIARQKFYDQRKYLDANFGIPNLITRNPYDKNINYRNIYDDYIRTKGS